MISASRWILLETASMRESADDRGNVLTCVAFLRCRKPWPRYSPAWRTYLSIVIRIDLRSEFESIDNRIRVYLERREIRQSVVDD